jgi:acyl-CoA reductase-like NAD-dependent aldehyde dehydrogenase
VRVGEAVLKRADEIADVVVSETGKPRTEAFTTELFPSLDAIVWLAKHAPKLLAPEKVRYPQVHLLHKRASLRYEPIGVVAVIAPWNFPFAIPFTQVAYALAAGNAAVLKPSELTPLSGALVAEIFAAAGAPVFVAQGDGAVGKALVEARGVGKVLFTGSAEVGRLVASAAGERLVQVTLELGGKDAMVVLADADLERAVGGALWGAFANCGQTCTSVERIYVERPLHDRFVERLAERARALRIPDELGPLVSERQRERVEELVESARDGLVTGGRRPGIALPGWFYEPTVIAGTSERLAGEEIFGPVVTVESFDSDEQALALANGSRFGLGASVWSRDVRRARRIASRIEAGMVWLNDVSYSYAAGQTPWGGVKDSGFGRTHSRHGLYECVRIKYADSDAGRLRVPWWFPYDERTAEGFQGFLDVFYGDGVRSAWRHRGALRELGRRLR